MRMNPAVIILFGLMATSLLLCIALAVAWRTFGRERHAALWAFAFGLSAATWALNLLDVWMPRADRPITLLVVITSIGCFALIALGFRRRVGLPERKDVMIAVGGVTILFAGWAVLFSANAGIARALVVFFCSAMLIVSARSLHAERQGSQRASGSAAFWMLTLFAGYTLGLGVLALCTSSTADLTYQLYHLLLLMGLPTGLFGVGLFAMFLLAADLAEAMRQVAASDPLTAILNRRGFEQAAGPLIAQNQRYGRPLAVVIADLDRFKAINDRFGHGVGDAVLQCFAEYVGGAIRQCDLFGRLGGEEFILVLPDTAAPEAIDAMERLRGGLVAAVRDLVPTAEISASFGVAMLDARGDSLADAMQRADNALYRSKLDGRDRITLADPPRTAPPLRWAAA
jgi:diguanylate cyclase (GGDEF)-like protein